MTNIIIKEISYLLGELYTNYDLHDDASAKVDEIIITLDEIAAIQNEYEYETELNGERLVPHHTLGAAQLGITTKRGV